MENIQAYRRVFDSVVSSTAMHHLVSEVPEVDFKRLPSSNADVVKEKMSQCSYRHGHIPTVYAAIARALQLTDDQVTEVYNQGVVETDRLTPADFVTMFSFSPSMETRPVLRITATITRVKGVRRSDSERIEVCYTVVPMRRTDDVLNDLAQAILDIYNEHPTGSDNYQYPHAKIMRSLRDSMTVTVGSKITFHRGS